jgi:hypothetical protein
VTIIAEDCDRINRYISTAALQSTLERDKISAIEFMLNPAWTNYEDESRTRQKRGLRETPPDHDHRFGHGKGEAVAAFDVRRDGTGRRASPSEARSLFTDDY